ncbi:MAG: hypothetical protein CME62_10045 [Halobacteriovoraceae bacterium]|nr:hypothetical protein [Halobacteriovoraceae bacterium]|tara:strand:- start:1595 stop:3331 length:1737 start_codon:yes stop_codon:yes gene_type:complete
MKYLVCLFFLFTSHYVYADVKAQVLVLSGDVTKLEPRSHKAQKVKKGDWLIQDTSVVTKDKSFVKIRFNDGSLMNIGPNSMVAINKMPTQKASVIKLLTGAINSEVKKTNKKKTKLIIRTRSAIMGVRGTKFQTSYNHANKRTSLVTVEGEVAMTKKVNNNINDEKLDELAEVFETNSTEVVEVKAGEYSGVAESIEKPYEPVRIAPEQYNALAKTMDSKLTATDVMSASEDKDAANAKYNDKKIKIKPKAGGYVDFNTGLYVEPLATAKFDESTATYTATEIGSINTSSADYIPPKGLKVDEVKGFVVDERAEEPDRKAASEKLQELNQSIKAQVTPVEKINKNSTKKPQEKNHSWGPKAQSFSLAFMPYGEKMHIVADDFDLDTEVESENANWLVFHWQHYWSENWSTSFKLGKQDYQFKEEFRKDHDDNGDSLFALGVKRKLTPKLWVQLEFEKRNEVVIVPEFFGDEGEGRIENNELDYFNLRLEYLAYQKEKSAYYLFLAYHKAEDKNFATLDEFTKDSRISGFSFLLNWNYQFSQKWSSSAGFRIRQIDVINNDVEIMKEEAGLNLALTYSI